MAYLSIACLALLVPTALAIPRIQNKSTGYPTGFPSAGPLATGGAGSPYGLHNSTIGAPVGTGVAPSQQTIVSIVPVQGSGAASEAPISTSESPIDHHAGGGNTESPVAGTAGISECGPATVTVTAANTVTVTVGAVQVSSSGEKSESPSTTPVASQEASSSVPIVVGTGTADLPIGTEKASETPSSGLSTGTPSVSPVANVAHGYHHASLHRKSSSSTVISVASTSTSEVPAPTTTSLPETSASEAPSVIVSTSTPAPEIISSNTQPASTPSTSKPATLQEYTYSPPEAASSTSVSEAPTSSSPLPQSSSSAPVAKSHVTTSSGGTKRGLVYNTAALTNSFSSSGSISWAYNWDSQPGGSIPANFDFVPQLWGPIPVHTGTWKQNADKAIAAGSTHILGFNEPDIPAQANLSPDLAKQAWIEYLEPYAGKAKLGSPAVCNGPAPMGLTWLSAFLDTCGSSCTVDFINIHWYGLATDDGVADFKDHVSRAAKVAGGREIWITEFQPSGSVADQAAFMDKILPWLDDSQSGVARYAYYQVDAILASGSGLTELGTKYAA